MVMGDLDAKVGANNRNLKALMEPVELVIEMKTEYNFSPPEYT